MSRRTLAALSALVTLTSSLARAQDPSWREPAHPEPAVAEFPEVESASASEEPAPTSAPSGETPAPTEPPSAATQPAPQAPPAVSPATTDAVAVDAVAWAKDYESAKALMREGKLAEAAALFEEASRSAPTRAHAHAASELASVCRDFERRRLRLVPAPPEVGGFQRARRRSTGEIASLYMNAVVYGVGSGAWVGVLNDSDEASGYFGPMLLFTGAAVGAIAIADAKEGLGYGVPQSISSGMYIGLSQGLIWSMWQNAHARRYEEWEPATVATVMWSGATAGAVLGGVVGETSGTTPGRASWVASTTLWGGVLGGSLAAAVVEDDYATDENALLGAAVGTTGGAIAGLFTAGDVSPSLARVRFIDLGGVVGALVGVGLNASFNEEPDEGVARLFGTTALTTAAGLGIAWFGTAHMKPDHGELPREEAAQGGLRYALENARPFVAPARNGVQLGFTGQL